MTSGPAVGDTKLRPRRAPPFSALSLSLSLSLRYSQRLADDLRGRIRRQVNIIYGLLRQSLRESRQGFLPTSAVAHVPFDHDTWILDPTRPRLIDMLTPREILWMRKEPPATRVMMD